MLGSTSDGAIMSDPRPNEKRMSVNGIPWRLMRRLYASSIAHMLVHFVSFLIVVTITLFLFDFDLLDYLYGFKNGGTSGSLLDNVTLFAWQNVGSENWEIFSELLTIAFMIIVHILIPFSISTKIEKLISLNPVGTRLMLDDPTQYFVVRSDDRLGLNLRMLDAKLGLDLMESWKAVSDEDNAEFIVYFRVKSKIRLMIFVAPIILILLNR